MGNVIEMLTLGFWAFVLILVVFKFVKSICLVPTKVNYIVERLGKYHKTLGPGFHVLIPFVDSIESIVDLKEHTIDVPLQTCFSKDEVKVEVDGVLYISVVDPAKASYGITDYSFAAIQLAQTTTRSVIGTLELDKTFEEREFISAKVVEVLDRAGETWGIRVHRYEIRNIQPPLTVKNAMEKQVTAERNRRAILAKSLGDKQSMINLSEGLKMETINHSEGEKLRQINEAEGRSQEILALATATATSIEKIANAVHQPGGEEAFTLKLMEKHIDNFKKLAENESRIIIPGNILDFDNWGKSLGLSLDKTPPS